MKDHNLDAFNNLKFLWGKVNFFVLLGKIR